MAEGTAPDVPVFAGFEVAVCATSAGVALGPAARVLDVRGPEGELACLEPWLRISRHRALVLEGGAPARARELDDVAVTEVSSLSVPIVIAGPMAAQIALRAVERRVAPFVWACPAGGHVRLLVSADDAPATRARLLQAGAPHGAAIVSPQAVGLFIAAQRTAAHPRTASPSVALAHIR